MTKKKKTILEIASEIEKMLAESEIGARDVLHILKEIETNAMLVLTIAQMATMQAMKPEEDEE